MPTPTGLPFLPEPLLPDAAPMLVLGIVLLMGVLFGTGAKLLRLPSVTGQILAGFLAGGFGLHLIDGKAALEILQPLNQFALALMA
ncbi:MAG: hypothetical protein AAFZ65_15370, partial [Planctomycetota bacterium]